MKHKFLFLTIIFLLLTSCDSTIYEIPENHNQITTKQDYHISDAEFTFDASDDRAVNTINRKLFTSGNIRYYDGAMYMTSGGMVYRYDIEDGGVIPLCIDPLCMHSDADCPFYGIAHGYIFIHNNKIYYKRNYNELITDAVGIVKDVIQKRERVCFDIAKQELKLLDTWEHGTRIESEFFSGDYRYYLNTIVGDDNALTFSINRESLENGKIEVLRDMGEWIAGILFVDGDTVYLSDGTGIYRFSVNETKAPELVCLGSYGVIGYSDGNFYAQKDREIVCIQADSGNITVLHTSNFDIDDLCMTQDYFYFRSKEKISYGRFNSLNAGQEIFGPKSDIYRIPVSGGDAELIYSLPEEMKHYILGNFVVDGNYLYAQWCYYNTETGEYFESWNHAEYDYMRVDIRNGDVYYIDE